MTKGKMLPKILAREAGRQSFATSVDVACRAGVSQSAVSLVFAGKATGRMTRKTQETIFEAARELGYRPNRAAQALRLGSSHFILLAVPDVSNPYFASVLQGAEATARQHGYSVMLGSIRDQEDWQNVVMDALSSRSVDGFLVFAMSPPSVKERIAIQGRAVLVDEMSEELPFLWLDIQGGMRAAVDHLINLGHTRIGHLAAAVDAETFRVRYRAYLETLRKAGISANSIYQARSSFEVTDASKAASSILRCSAPPSAIVCDSDVLAVGVYKAAREEGLSIPRDLSVVGFDDSSVARVVHPELTTVAIPTSVIGQRAVQLLLSVLAARQVPLQTVVPLELVVRASTAEPSGMGAR